MYIYKYHYWIFEEFNCNIHVLYFYGKYNSKTLTNLGSNWQQTRLDFDYETIIICLRFWLWISIKSADKLCQQIGSRNRAVCFRFCSQSALNLSSDYAFCSFAVICCLSICWQSISSRFFLMKIFLRIFFIYINYKI